MIHVKRLYQTILIQFRMIATLLNWIYCCVDLRKEKFSNLVVDKFCALLYSRYRNERQKNFNFIFFFSCFLATFNCTSLGFTVI